MNQPQSASTDASDVRQSSGWRQTFAALHYPNYRLLWSTTVFISAGNWIQQVTIGWLAFEMTDSALQTGAIVGVRALPLMFAPMSGVIADRFDRRRLLMLNQAALAVVALVFAGIVLADLVAVWHLYAFSLISGMAWSLNNPIRQVLVGNSVPREMLTNAIALNSLAFNSMRIVGPAVGGALIFSLGGDIDGAGFNFLIQAALYTIVYFVLIPYRPAYSETARNAREQSPWADLADGFKYVLGHRTTLTTILLTLVPTLTMMSFVMTMMPVYAAKDLGFPDGDGIGLLTTAMGLGGLVGTLFVARFYSIQRKGMMVLVGIMGTGVFIIVLAFVETIWLAMLVLVVQQAFVMLIMTNTNTIIQTITPDGMRGRVMGVYMLDIGMQPLGGVVAGVLATLYGVPVAWVIGSTVGLIIAAIVAVFAKSFRELRI